MPTLKEILAERKRAAASVQTEPQLPTADNQVVVAEIPQYVFAPPLTEFQALFADCEDF